MLALIKDNEFVSQHSEGSRLDLEGDIVVMPIKAGTLFDGYSLHTILPAGEIPEGKMVSETSVELVDGAWTYVNTLVDIPVYVPEEISRRQFFQQLAVQELITNTEALAAVQTGAIPEAINAIIYSLPAESRFSAQMLVSGAMVFDRNNPLSEIVRVALDWTEEQKNQFWIDAYKL